jgi:putative phosphoesterase
MRIGIVSDTHSRLSTVARALDLLAPHQVACVLHCGDIEDAATVRLFRDVPTHFVFGNCDHDRQELRDVIAEVGATIQEPFGNLELEGRKIAWIHGDDARLFRDLEHSGQFDFLFYGHSHHAEQHRTGPTLVVNPGALHRARVKTIVVLDLTSGALQSVVVE